MSLENITKNFGVFKVKPIWRLLTVSTLLSSSAGLDVQLYGVDRGTLDISRNWEKVNSVEQFNQGWTQHPTDYSITIAMKTKGIPFEIMRRLEIGNVMFDIQLDVLRSDNKVVGSLSPAEALTLELPGGWVPWLAGYEIYKGCVIQRTGRTIEIGGLPVQEFECSFLRLELTEYKFNALDVGSIESGDGSTPDVSADIAHLETLDL